MDLGEDIEPNVQETEEKMATLKEDAKNSMTKQKNIQIFQEGMQKIILCQMPSQS